MALPSLQMIRHHFGYIIGYNLFASNKEDLGRLIDFPSLKNNSITKMPDKKIAVAYARLDESADKLYSSGTDLATIMDEFIAAVEFYKKNDLKRLSAFSDEHKMRTCYELAEYVCGNHELPHDKKLVALCYRIYDVDRDLSKVNVAFLILLILGVVDTDSDIKNRIDNDFATMTSFAEKFFVSHSPHDDCPLLNIYAREFGLTDNHNRFYMMCLFDIILLTVSLGVNNEYEFYQSWNESKRVFDVCDCIWKDDDEDNLFYQFDYTPADYGYILTQYLIMPCSRTVKLIKYSVCFYYGDGDNRLEFFVLHPRGSYYAATGKEKVSLNEKAWLYCEVDDRIRPDNIVFTKKEKKPNFDFNAKKIVRLVLCNT